MISARRLSRDVALCVLACVAPILARAQTVVITSPVTSKLQTATPVVSVRTLNVPSDQRPLRYTLYVTGPVVTDNPYIDTVSVVSNDTIASLLVSKLLPSDGTVNFRVRVTQPNGQTFDSQTLGPYKLPRWLTLIRPNSPQVSNESTRKPTFIWSSAKVDPSFGVWKYDLQITDRGTAQLSTAGLTDTVFTPSDELYANTSYRWQVHATLKHGEEANEYSLSTFIITDPSLPTTTLLYQNFPNPFPSATSFSTCFWFDIGAAGGMVSLDVFDFRGNLVRRIIPTQLFSPGNFGRGASGSQNSCDNRYVWDGTATDGRTVPRGIYLVRLIVGGSAPLFKKIDFRGR